MDDPANILRDNDMLKEQLDMAFNERIIDEDEYNKSIAELSYLYAINGFPDDCILMLMNLKGDYFQDIGIQHFKEDNEFFSKCYVILEVLNFIGYVPFDALATQKLALA